MYHLSMNEQTKPQPCNVIDLIGALVRTGKVIEARLDEALAAVGLTSSQWEMLRTLKLAGEPLPLGEIADQVACVKSNVTQLADRLEAQGLVARVPNPKDRRSTRAVLTLEGHARHAEGERIVRQFEAAYLNDLDANERHAMDAFLARMEK